MINVDDILEQLPRGGVYTLRDRVSQVVEIIKAAPVEVNNAQARLDVVPKAQGAPYALDAWPNEDEV